MAHKVTKQPWERFPVSIDFSSEMETGDVVVAGLSEYEVELATVDDPIVVEDSMVVVDDTKLQVTIYGGVSGSRYKINMRAHVNADKKLEDDFYVVVRD